MTTEEFVMELDSMDPSALLFGAGLVGIMLTIMLVVMVVVFFVSALGYRKMFLKAGYAGWKAFIPYYRNFICFKFAWNTNMFWPFLISILMIQCAPTTENLAVQLLCGAAGIIFIVFSVKLDVRIAKSFGKTATWGVLLFFFPFIVSLILGYGSAEYIRNSTLETSL